LISLVPKKAKPANRRAFYKSPPPPPPERGLSQAAADTNASNHPGASNLPRRKRPLRVETTRAPSRDPDARREFRTLKFIAPSHFTLREDGSIGTPASGTARSKQAPNAVLDQPSLGSFGTAGAGAPIPDPRRQLAAAKRSEDGTPSPRLIFSSEKIWLYHGNSLELLDAIAAKYPDGRFDAIFADPPYFLPAGP